MKNVIIIILVSVMAMLMTACNSERAEEIGNATDRAYYVVTYSSRGYKNLPTSKSRVALYLPEKQKLVFFYGLDSNDQDQYKSTYAVYQTQQSEGMINACMVAYGEPGKNYGDPHSLVTEGTEKILQNKLRFMATRDTIQDAPLVTSYDLIYGDIEWMYLIPADDMTDHLKSLLGHEEFAQLSDFIDSYKQSGDVLPKMSKEEMAQYRTRTIGADFILYHKGVKWDHGEIKLGDNINDLPEAIGGLYDKVTVEPFTDEMEGVEATQISFTLNGEEVMSAYSYDEQTIAYITVNSPLVVIEDYNNYYGVGTPIDSSIRKFSSVDDYGRLEFKQILIDEDANGCIYTMSIGEPLM